MAFYELIRDKYEKSYQTSGAVQILVISTQFVNAPKVKQLQVVSLQRSILETAGDQSQIASQCPNIKQLDISATKIRDWREVIKIVNSLKVLSIQRLEFLDVSYIVFLKSTFEDPQQQFENLRCLALQGCRLEPEQLIVISQTFPALNKLILQDLVQDCTQVFREWFMALHSLDMTNSSIQTFQQVLNLSSIPNLVQLKLCRNPLSSIEWISGGFCCLKSLNLEQTEIRNLNSIHALNSFQVLKDVRVTNTPFQSRFGNSSRFMVICYLPKIEVLNGGSVSQREKTSNERQFVRQFSHPQEPHQHTNKAVAPMKELIHVLEDCEFGVNQEVFRGLSEKHGVVMKFAQVSFAIPSEVKVRIMVEDLQESVQEHVIPLRWKLKDLKEFCQDVFGIPTKRQRLFHGSTEFIDVLGYEEIRYGSSNLTTLKISDGDIILISTKKFWSDN